MTGDRYGTGFRGVAKLAVAAYLSIESPTISFEHVNDLSYLHAKLSLAGVPVSFATKLPRIHHIVPLGRRCRHVARLHVGEHGVHRTLSRIPKAASSAAFHHIDVAFLKLVAHQLAVGRLVGSSIGVFN